MAAEAILCRRLPGLDRVIMSNNAFSALRQDSKVIRVGLTQRYQTIRLRSNNQESLIDTEFLPLPPEELSKVINADAKLAIIYPSCVELECTEDEINLNLHAHRVALTRWVYFYNYFAELASAKIKKHRPDIIVIFQGYSPEDAILRELAIKNDIPLLAIERAAYGKSLTWDNISGLAVTKNLARNLYWKNEFRISDENALDFARSYFESIRKSKQEEHTTPNTRFPFHRKTKHGPKILFIAQVYTDASTLFGRVGDMTQLAALNAVVDSCIELDYDLLIKLHPKENRGMSPIGTKYTNLTYRKMQQDQELREKINADMITVDHENRWDTFQAIHDCDIVVTHSSQAGLEAAIQRKPVLLYGDSFYRGLGFTTDLRDINDLKHELSKGLSRGVAPDDAHLKACRFFYSFMHDYAVEFTPKNLFKLLRKLF